MASGHPRLNAGTLWDQPTEHTRAGHLDDLHPSTTRAPSAGSSAPISAGWHREPAAQTQMNEPDERAR